MTSARITCYVLLVLACAVLAVIFMNDSGGTL